MWDFFGEEKALLWESWSSSWCLTGICSCGLSLAGRDKVCDLVASLPWEGSRHFCFQHNLERNDLNTEYLSNFPNDAPWLWLQLSALFCCECHLLYPDYYILLFKWKQSHPEKATHTLLSRSHQCPARWRVRCSASCCRSAAMLLFPWQ